MTNRPRGQHLWRSLLIQVALGTGIIRGQPGSAHLVINQVDSESFPTVRAHFTITGATGLPLEGLDPTAFSLSEDDRPVDSFEVSEITEGGQPISVVIAVDTSGSMTSLAKDSAGKAATALANTQAAAEEFVKSLAPGDQVGLVAFADEASVVVPLTTDIASVAAAIDGLEAQGETALYDAIVVSVGLLKDLPAGRKAVILLADGQNNSSNFTLDEAADEAADWSIPIDPIGFGNVNRETMEKIAALTGGYAQIRPDSTALGEAFDELRRVLRHQYLVEFSSDLPADGASHTLTISLEFQGAQLQGSHTFVARPGEVMVALEGLADGATVGGDVRLAPNVLAPAPVRQVSFDLDGAPLAAVTAAPFEYTWDSTAVTPGEHQLTATAEDGAGNTGALQLKLTVRPPILLQWVTPASGDQVASPQKLAVEVDALAGVARVQFFVDGELLGEVTTFPYEMEWTLEDVEPGSHALRATVVDVNNRSADAEVDVLVTLRSNSLILGIALVVLIAGGILVVPLASRRRKRLARLARGEARPGQSPEVQAAVALKELEGLEPGRVWRVRGPEIRIGRKRAENDIPAAGRSASRQHALLRVQEGRVVLENVNPDNPSLVNDQPVQSPYELKIGDVIRIGESAFRFGAGSQD